MSHLSRCFEWTRNAGLPSTSADVSGGATVPITAAPSALHLRRGRDPIQKNKSKYEKALRENAQSYYELVQKNIARQEYLREHMDKYRANALNAKRRHDTAQAIYYMKQYKLKERDYHTAMDINLKLESHRSVIANTIDNLQSVAILESTVQLVAKINGQSSMVSQCENALDRFRTLLDDNDEINQIMTTESDTYDESELLDELENIRRELETGEDSLADPQASAVAAAPPAASQLTLLAALNMPSISVEVTRDNDNPPSAPSGEAALAVDPRPLSHRAAVAVPQ
jgi:hypothetical protein